MLQRSCNRLSEPPNSRSTASAANGCTRTLRFCPVKCFTWGGTFLCDTRQGRLLTIRLPFLAQAPPTYQVLGKAKFGTTERSFLAEPQSFEVSLPFDSASPTRFGEFLLMGIRHIGAAPGEWVDSRGLHLPDGIDHILFLLALILGGGGFWKILQTATGFTLGHSVTLALASLGVVKLPGRVVESAIALSIVYVAVEAFRKRDGEGRWKIAALFGLVHGFGFATALNELALGRAAMVRALVGFNLGVECGQALLIALILPWIYLAKSRPAFHEVSLRACSCAIGLAGSYWFLERAFGLSL